VAAAKDNILSIFLFLALAALLIQTNVHAQASSANDWVQIDDPNMAGYDVYRINAIPGFDSTSSMVLTCGSDKCSMFKWKKDRDNKTYFSFYLNGKLIEKCQSFSWGALKENPKINNGDQLKWELRSQRNKATSSAWIAISKEKNGPEPPFVLYPDPMGNQTIRLDNKTIFIRGYFNGLHIIDSNNLSLYRLGDTEIVSNDITALSIENSCGIRIYDMTVASGKYSNIQIENSSNCLLKNNTLKDISKIGIDIYNSSNLVLDSNHLRIANMTRRVGIFIEGSYSDIKLMNNQFIISNNTSIIRIDKPAKKGDNGVYIYGNNSIINYLTDQKDVIASVSEGDIGCTIYDGKYCCKNRTELNGTSSNKWYILKEWECNANN
jgi:parallel beta-helix repeat protein